MPMAIEDAHRLLSSLLLRGPRDPRSKESHTYRFASSILESFGYKPSDSPVTGVARTVDGNGLDKLVVFLLEEKAMKLGTYAAESLGITKAGFGVNEIVSGEIILNGRERPSQGGDSIGQGRPGGKSGTFGCLVKNAPGDLYILSCSHVVVEQATILSAAQNYGTSVWQPSYDDGGKQSDNIGWLVDYKPIAFGGFTPNEIDAALVEASDNNDVMAGLRGVGALNGTALKIDFRDKVNKNGCKTGVTHGHYLYKTDYIQNFYGVDALFENQLGITWSSDDAPFSKDGDSGALVINASNQAAGLLFASAPFCRISWANPIWSVFNWFGVVPV